MFIIQRIWEFNQRGCFFNDTEAGSYEKEDIFNLDHFFIPFNWKYIIEGDCFLNEKNLTWKCAISWVKRK